MKELPTLTIEKENQSICVRTTGYNFVLIHLYTKYTWLVFMSPNSEEFQELPGGTVA